MGASKPKVSRSPAPALQTLRWLLRPSQRGPLIAVIVFAAAIGGLRAAWQRWGAPSTLSAEYSITPDKISLTPAPPWIHADIKTEVVRAAGLTELNLRNPKLVEEVAAAFALHPWVAQVVRVEKRYPARLEVAVEYRRPVAAVELTARTQPGLLFVDAAGVLLPSADFAQEQAKDFLRISAGSETPAGVYGTAWGSERITGAARLAAAWEGQDGSQPWQKLKLYRIVPAQNLNGELLYELRTQAGARVMWGAAPGSEAAGEATAKDKIARLEQHVADKGPLDREGAPSLLDLRQP